MKCVNRLIRNALPITDGAGSRTGAELHELLENDIELESETELAAQVMGAFESSLTLSSQGGRKGVKTNVRVQ